MSDKHHTIENNKLTEHTNPHALVMKSENNIVEVTATDGIPRDALKIKNIVLEEDFYALTWISLKWDIWADKKIRGKSIFLGPADFFWIHMNFIIFLCLITVTIWLILLEVLEDKEYIASNITIVVLRVTLVCFAQKSLSPEFFQGLFLLRYSTRNTNQFTHYQFAVFVGACQLLVASIVFIGIMLFVCTAEEALELVVEFAGISIIAKLDNWIGEAIMLSKPELGESESEEDEHSISHVDEVKERKENDNKEYDLTNINIRMSLSQKMSLIEEHDLILLDDQNDIQNAHWIIKALDYVVHFWSWQYILPFFTLIFNYVMPLLHPETYEIKKHE